VFFWVIYYQSPNISLILPIIDLGFFGVGIAQFLFAVGFDFFFLDLVCFSAFFISAINVFLFFLLSNSMPNVLPYSSNYFFVSLLYCIILP